jgi:hydrogenase maturation factor HypF (carbamoyltransferase family)
MQLSRHSRKRPAKPQLRMYLVPCSCGASFAVSEDYDRSGTSLSRYLVCPSCGKRHDPRNRLLELGYHADGYWKVDKC